MKDIKVSVVIPCYNSEGTIVRAVNSVLSGKILPFEILIYDDCSEDNTVKIIEENFKSNSLITLTKGIENKGAGYARDILLKNANGDFVAFLDADDWWYPEKLEMQIEKIKAENYDIVTSGYDIYDEELQKIGSRFQIKNINYFTMHLTNWLPTSMTVFRKNLIGAQEMPKIRRRQDYGFWIKLFAKNYNLRCFVINQPLGGYTRRLDSLSASRIKNLKANFTMFRKVMRYRTIIAVLLVCINMAFRIFRK